MTDAYGVDPETFAEGPDAWMDAIIQVYASLGGEGLVGLIIGAGLMLTLYIHSGDMALPTVVLILLSSALFVVLPGDYQQIAVNIIIVGIAAGLFEIFRRYMW